MGLGILESRMLERVPGTVRYFDNDANDEPLAPRDTLKRTSGPNPIVLVPQPSSSPHDPLNWPLWRRDLITLLLSLTAIFATSLSPILAANTITISLLFAKDFTRVALLTGYFLLGAGAGAAVFVPSSRVWGKRHALVVGLCVAIASSAWAGAIRDDYDSFIVARVFQGIGVAPWETLISAVVGDLYHVHERGLRMAFANLAIFGGAFFTPVVVGDITHAMGWWWTFNFVAIFLAAMLPIIVLFCPETAYRRDKTLDIDITPAADEVLGAVERQSESRPGMSRTNDTDEDKEVGNSGNMGNIGNNDLEEPGSRLGEGEEAKKEKEKEKEDEDGEGEEEERARSFAERISLFDGRKSDGSFVKLLLRPFPLLLHPAFFWACLIQGTMIGWTVFIGVILAAVYQGPPSFWTEVETGHAYTGAFVGALVGFAIAGLLADWSARWLTARNGGVFEPEFRLVLVVPMFVFAATGLYGFGVTASNFITGRYAAAVPLAFFGFQVAGMVLGAVSSSLYIVDGYRDLAIEGFTCTIIFKNLFSFLITFFAYQWILDAGPQTVLVAIASVQVGICLLSVPMYVYGKRIRALSHRHDILAYLKLR